MSRVYVRNLKIEDIESIARLAERVPGRVPLFSEEQLGMHLRDFPEGQFVAVDESGVVFGMATNLIVQWNDYVVRSEWNNLTESGLLTRHDPVNGRTLYGTDFMIDPRFEHGGIGFRLCRARRQLTQHSGLHRIRSAVPLPGYDQHKDEWSPPIYVEKVVRRELDEPALSCQLRNGLEVLAVVLERSRGSSGDPSWAALIEWRNPAWSSYHVRRIRATRGLDYNFRNNMQRARSVRQRREQQDIQPT